MVLVMVKARDVLKAIAIATGAYFIIRAFRARAEAPRPKEQPPTEERPKPYEPEQPPPPPPECMEGETKCEGYDLYQCVGGKWVLVESNSPTCGYKPPECTEGEAKCEGYDLYQCVNGQWVLVKSNAEECGYKPPKEAYPMFRISGFRFERQTCKPVAGETITYTVTIENYGYATGTYDLIINGRKMAYNVLGPGASYTHRYYIPCDVLEPGTYTLKIEVFNRETGQIDDSKTATYTVEKPTVEEAITLTNVRARPTEVEVGEKFFVDFIFDKRVSGHFDIELCVDTACTTVPGNQVPEVPGTFQLTMSPRAPSEPGTYTFTATARLADGTGIGSGTVTIHVKPPGGYYVKVILEGCDESGFTATLSWSLPENERKAFPNQYDYVLIEARRSDGATEKWKFDQRIGSTTITLPWDGGRWWGVTLRAYVVYGDVTKIIFPHFAVYSPAVYGRCIMEVDGAYPERTYTWTV